MLHTNLTLRHMPSMHFMSHERVYAFPPFSILQRVLQKFSEEEATGLLVVPNWPTQIWWPYLMNMLIDFPLILPRKQDTL